MPLQLYLLAVFWFAKYAAGLGIDASEVACEAMAFYKGVSSAAMAMEVEAWWAENCAFRLRPKARRRACKRAWLWRGLAGVCVARGRERACACVR